MNIGNLIQQVGDNLQFVLVCALVVAALIAVSKAAEMTFLKGSVAHVGKTRYVAICGMLGALACVLHLMDFPLVFLAPEFYKLDFS